MNAVAAVFGCFDFRIVYVRKYSSLIKIRSINSERVYSPWGISMVTSIGLPAGDPSGSIVNSSWSFCPVVIFSGQFPSNTVVPRRLVEESPQSSRKRDRQDFRLPNQFRQAVRFDLQNSGCNDRQRILQYKTGNGRMHGGKRMVDFVHELLCGINTLRNMNGITVWRVFTGRQGMFRLLSGAIRECFWSEAQMRYHKVG